MSIIDNPVGEHVMDRELPNNFGMVEAELGPLYDLPEASYTVTFDAEQIAQVERLVHAYTEALATYNVQSASKQRILESLNEAWELIFRAMKNPK